MNLIKLNYRAIYRLGMHHGSYFLTMMIYSALPLLFLPILTRYLSPGEYANISIFRFYMAISNCVVGSSIPIAISKYFFDKSQKYTSEIIGNSFIIAFSISIILSVIIYLFENKVVSIIALPLEWIIIIPWVSFAYTIYNVALTVMRNRKKPGTFSLYKIGNSIINISISILLVVVVLWGWQGRLWGIIASFFLSSIFALYYLHRKGFIGFTPSKQAIKKLLRLIVPLIPSSLQAIIITQVGIFFMQYFFNKELLGVYSVGFQLSFAMKILYTSIMMSWAPLIFEKLANRDKINKKILVRQFYILALILFSGVVFLNIFTEFILKIVVTPSYFGAKEFIPWFTIGFFFVGMCAFIQPILIKGEKQKFISIVSTSNMLFLILLNIILVKLFGYIAIAISFSLSAFIQFAVFFYMVQKIFPLPWFSALVLIKK